MFAPATVDLAMSLLSERLNHAMPSGEAEAMIEVWIPQWRDRWAKDVAVPVLLT